MAIFNSNTWVSRGYRGGDGLHVPRLIEGAQGHRPHRPPVLTWKVKIPWENPWENMAKLWENHGKKYGVSSFQCKWKFEYAHYRILSINMEAFLLPHLSSRRDRPRVDWSSKRFAVLNTATVERSGELPEVLHWTMDVGWIWNRFGCFVSSLMFFFPASTHCSHTRCFHTFCFGDVWFRPTWLCHLLPQHLGFEHVWGRIE